MNDRVYVGPLKYIVCLLGDDVYPVNKFMMKHKERLARHKNISISIMTLSSEVKNNHTHDYRKLCGLTREGVFVNAVKKESIERVGQSFLATMDVFPSNQRLAIREFFGAF